MPKFTELELNLYVETTCSRCFQPDEARKRVLGQGDGCPILKRARRGQMSAAWKRRRRGALGETFECSLFTPTPPSTGRRTAPVETESMFDVPESERLLVPVEGWEDYRARERGQSEGEHQ